MNKKKKFIFSSVFAIFIVFLMFILTPSVSAAETETEVKDFAITDTSKIENDFETMGLDYETYAAEASYDYSYDRNIVVGIFESFEKGTTKTKLYVYVFNGYKVQSKVNQTAVINGKEQKLTIKNLDVKSKLAKYETNDYISDTEEFALRKYEVTKFNNEKQILNAEFNNFEDAVNYNFDAVIPITSAKIFSNHYSNLHTWKTLTEDWKWYLQNWFGTDEQNYSNHWYAFNTPVEMDDIKSITLDYSYRMVMSSGQVFDNTAEYLAMNHNAPINSYSKTYSHYVEVEKKYFDVDYRGYEGTLPTIVSKTQIDSTYSSLFEKAGVSLNTFKDSKGNNYDWAVCFKLTPNSYCSYSEEYADNLSEMTYHGLYYEMLDASMISIVYEKDGEIVNALALQREKTENGGGNWNGPVADGDQCGIFDELIGVCEKPEGQCSFVGQLRGECENENFSAVKTILKLIATILFLTIILKVVKFVFRLFRRR